MTTSGENKGWTVVTYFPPKADSEAVLRFQNTIALLAEKAFEDREGWNPSTFAHRGDVFQIDKDCECCAPHVYLSTSCFHNDHNYCKGQIGLVGNKTPAVCKFCKTPCICPCHRDAKPAPPVQEGT